MSLDDNSYLEFEFAISPLEPAREILIAELGELEFESFLEQETGLLAYVLKKSFEENGLNDLFVLQNPNFKISWSSREIKQQNWNIEWERNFTPIMVNETCLVRAPFHPEGNVEYDIVIEPKMSFGTGHHETTHMMLEHILEHDFRNKKVLDMGCGTGVLAILAEKKGAQHVEAIDVDVWCYENALENVERNNCQTIDVAQGDSQLLHQKKYDIILANINRNVLLQDISKYADSLNENGLLFLSGFYFEDLTIINAKCKQHGLEFHKNLEKNRWVSAKYVN